MATTRETIDHTTLTRLVEAGAVRGADVIGQPGGWGVVVKYGMTERALAVRRGQVRIFRRFEALVGYLKALGLSRYTVDASGYDPAAPASLARPDTAERLRRAHEAAEHDRWFRAQVQAALDDPRPTIPHDVVMADLRAMLDGLADDRAD
jgi:hypothetical protein